MGMSKPKNNQHQWKWNRRCISEGY